MNNLTLSVIVPILSFAIIAIFAITLGYVFYQVHHNTSIRTGGVIVIRLILLIATQVIAYLIERSTEK